MTTRRLKPVVTLALISLAVVSDRPIRAEVAAVPLASPSANLLLFAGINDGPDPIGSVMWRRHRIEASALALNAEGDSRGDGRPDFATLLSGAPLVVWAYNNGAESDVVYSEWTGSAWSPIAPIAMAAANELDPRVFVKTDGSVHVVWWEEGGAGRVLLSTRSAGSAAWSAPVQVNPVGEVARRPSVVADGGTLRVAYERPIAAPGAGQEIVLATEQAGGSFAYEVVATTPRTGALDPILNLVRGKLWVDWMEDGQSFGCARITGTQWEPSVFVPWSDGTWLGVEEMRRVVRRTVLAVQ